MTVQSNGGRHNVSTPAEAEIDSVTSEAKPVGFDEGETVSALYETMRHAGRTDPQSPGIDALQQLSKDLVTARGTALEYGNERIIYLVGLALDEAKANRKNIG